MYFGRNTTALCFGAAACVFLVFACGPAEPGQMVAPSPSTTSFAAPTDVRAAPSPWITPPSTPPGSLGCKLLPRAPSGPHIKVFVDNYFARYMRSHGTRGDERLSQTQVDNAVMQVAETWNLETRSKAFVFAGRQTYLDEADWARHFRQYAPAVLIHYVPGSHPFLGQEGPLGHDMFVVRMPEKHDGTIVDWQVGTRSYPTGKFANVLLHELGHVLGLGHLSDEGRCLTVMTPSSGACVLGPCETGADCGENQACEDGRCVQHDGGRHPLSDDKACVAQAALAPRRSVEVYGYFWDTDETGHFFRALGHNTKGMLSGGHMRDASTGDPYYVDYLTTRARSGEASPFHPPSWRLEQFEGPTSDHLANLDVAPFLFAAEEFSAQEEAGRVNFLDADDAAGVERNPPYAKFIAVDRSMLVQTSADRIYQQCDNESCSAYHPLRTHLPVAATYDPISDRTIVVSVSTDSVDGSDGAGDLLIYPGIVPGHPARLRQPTVVRQHQMPSSPIAGWSYAARTDTAASIACADSSWSGFGNCLLAYVDKGVMDGELLYAYFRVDTSSNTIEWDGDFARRGGSSSASVPGVAYFNDKFWIAYKTVSAIPHIVVQSTTSGYTWTTRLDHSEPRAVDPPTFLYAPGDVSGVVWSVSD